MNRTERVISAFFFGLATLSGSSGQELVTPAWSNPAAAAFYSLMRPVQKSLSADSLDLPLFEDFSTGWVIPDRKVWSDSGAFINNNYGVDPVSNGVATLDALAFDGSLYQHATIDPVTFEADRLTSLPIRLTYPDSDSLYLSFLYQPGGLGDLPEAQDSLLVDFFDPATGQWMNVWGVPGTSLHPFRHAMIPVTDSRYLTAGFRFRFRNLASLPRNEDYPDKRSNVDHWQLDYVRLDRYRFAGDTILRDVAFNTPLRSVLKDLTSIPWAHFENAYKTALDPTIPVRYRNSDTISRNITRTLTIEEPLYNETFSPGPPTAQDLPPMKDTVVEFGFIYPLDFQRGDSAIIRFKAALRTDEFDPKANDTVAYDQFFGDFYAYDDGTPEAGYGLRGQGTRNGSVAVKYTSYQPDRIGGVDISFNQLYDSVNLDYYFKLVVWEDNGGVPGMAILEDGNDYVPVYTEHYPGFTRYRFSSPIEVDGDFYIGWRQYNEYMLNVGLDLNNRPSPHVMFYNYQGTWVPSNAPGVILFRPFLYDETTGSSTLPDARMTLKIFPNPASAQVYIEVPGKEEAAGMELELFDTSGRLSFRTHLQTGYLDVSRYPAGIYLVRIRTEQEIYTAKLQISR